MRITILLLLTLGLTFNSFAECVNPGYEKYNKKGMIKGSPAIGGSPAEGVGYLQIKDIGKIFKNKKENEYIFIDTRPEKLFKECTIKDAINVPFKFSGNGELNKLFLQDKIKSGKKIVFFCNSLKCYRSLNAAIESRCNYNLDAGSVFWFGRGTAALASSPDAKIGLIGEQCSALRILLQGKKKH